MQLSASTVAYIVAYRDLIPMEKKSLKRTSCGAANSLEMATS